MGVYEELESLNKKQPDPKQSALEQPNPTVTAPPPPTTARPLPKARDFSRQISRGNSRGISRDMVRSLSRSAIRNSKSQDPNQIAANIPTRDEVQEFSFYLRDQFRVKVQAELPAGWQYELEDIARELDVKKMELYRFIFGEFLGKVKRKHAAKASEIEPVGE